MEELNDRKLRIMSIPQAAEAGLLNESALRTLVREGSIPSITIGTRSYINFDVACDIVYQMSVTPPKKEEENADAAMCDDDSEESGKARTDSLIIPERLYTSSEVRDILRIGKSTYYELINKREIPHIELEGKFLIQGADILSFIARRTVRKKA